MTNLFRLFGILLTGIGAVLALTCYIAFGSMPLTAGGLSAIVLGSTIFALTGNISQIHQNLPKLVVSIIIAFSVIDILLAFYGVNDIGAYLNYNIIAYLMIVMVYLCFNPESSSVLINISAFLIVLSLIILGFKMFNIVKG